MRLLRLVSNSAVICLSALAFKDLGLQAVAGYLASLIFVTWDVLLQSHFKMHSFIQSIFSREGVSTSLSLSLSLLTASLSDKRNMKRCGGVKRASLHHKLERYQIETEQGREKRITYSWKNPPAWDLKALRSYPGSLSYLEDFLWVLSPIPALAERE